MSRLLDQRRIDTLTDIARGRVDHAVERVRHIMYSEGANSTPPGMDNLDAPEKVQTVTRFIQRQTAREQRGVVGGNLNQALAEHPAVQQMAIESGEQEPVDG